MSGNKMKCYAIPFGNSFPFFNFVDSLCVKRKKDKSNRGRVTMANGAKAYAAAAMNDDHRES